MTASAKADGQTQRKLRTIILPYAIVAAAFGAVEYVLDLVPGSVLGVQSPYYDVVDAAARAVLVPFALLATFYVLARRTQPDPRLSHIAIAASIFLGTLLVFVPVDLGRQITGTPLPGFTIGQTEIISIGDAVSSSINHVFIGFFAVFLWELLERPPSISSAGALHGTEDVSLVGVVMVGVYAWEYLAQAYQSTYQLGVGNVLASSLASVLGAGSPAYYVVAIWQQIVLLMLLPFALFFLLAYKERLNPFVQSRKIMATILLWSLFLRAFTSYFYVYFVQLLKPGALAGQSFAATLASELNGPSLIGILVSTLGFLFLGFTAIVFGYYARERSGKAEEAPR